MNPPTCFIFYYYLWILKFPPNFFFQFSGQKNQLP